MEALSWPSECDMDENGSKCMDDFAWHEGICLGSDKIDKNPRQCSLAKLMLNSMWGKFGQRDNLMYVKEFTDPHPFFSVHGF